MLRLPTGRTTSSVKQLEGNAGRIVLNSVDSFSDDHCSAIKALVAAKVQEDVPFRVWRMAKSEAEKLYGDTMYDSFKVPDSVTELRLVNLEKWNLNANINQVLRSTGSLRRLEITKTKHNSNKKQLEINFECFPSAADAEKPPLAETIERLADPPSLADTIPQEDADVDAMVAAAMQATTASGASQSGAATEDNGSSEKKEKKPRPAPPPPPPALATAALLVRSAAARVLGLRPGTCGGEMQPLWVTEPGHAKVTISLDGCTRSPFPKDDMHGALLDAIEQATNELVQEGTAVTAFELDRVKADALYGDSTAEPKAPKGDRPRLAYIPGAILTEVPGNWSLCKSAGSCGSVAFQKAVDPGSKKKPDTMILYKKKQLMVRYQVQNPDAEGADLAAPGAEPPAAVLSAFDSATVRMEVPGVDTAAESTAAFVPPARVGEAAAAVTDEADEAVVDPWQVSGKIDYTKLIEKFGSTPISPELLARIERLTVGRGNVPELHPWLRRGIFFSHRDLDLICKMVEEGKPFYLYTGRGPSSLAMHLGHLIPFMMTAWLQKAFDVPLVIQMTDDEKFLWKGQWDPETADDNLMMYRNFTTENAKDIIAVGFDKSKTFIFSDLEYVGHMYPNIVRIWKAITYNTARSSFGFVGESNIGQSAFPAVQAAPSFPSSFKIPLCGQDNMGCLIPCAIDQDPYFRITRDVAHKIVPTDHPLKGKPALIHAKFFPPLQGAQGKMSASDTSSAIYLTDSPEEIKNKIHKYAFSGGRVTAKEQREKGAELDVDVSYQWLRFFLDDDQELEHIGQSYSTGKGDFWNTGSVKDRLVLELQRRVKDHQARRDKITDEEVAEWMEVRKLQF